MDILNYDATEKRQINKYKLKWATSDYSQKYSVLQENVKIILDQIKDREFNTLLDWGCGNGKLLGLLEATEKFKELHGYDPAVSKFSKIDNFLESYDLIICTDVLEHISIPYIPITLDRIKYFGKNCLFSMGINSTSDHLLLGDKTPNLSVLDIDQWVLFLKDVFNDAMYLGTSHEVVENNPNLNNSHWFKTWK